MDRYIDNEAGLGYSLTNTVGGGGGERKKKWGRAQQQTL